MSIQSINNGVIQVGVDLAMGAGIAELKLIAGSNYVDVDDTGRLIQASIYDGNGLYTDQTPGTGTWGWNPVTGGDTKGAGSPIIYGDFSSSLLYTKTDMLEWYPDNKGGGAGTPIYAETYCEQWIELPAAWTKVVKVSNRITYYGATNRRHYEQEMPAMYLVTAYNNLSRYAGTSPWTSDTITTIAAPTGAQSTNYYASELWAALLDGGNDGIALYCPGQFPYVRTRAFAGDTNYLRMICFETFDAGDVLSFVYYLVVGDITASRATIYQIRAAELVTSPDMDTYPSIDHMGMNVCY